MRILICNDDGIFAPGIIELVRRFADMGDVYVVAPDRERSAASHALTISSPLRAEEVEFAAPVKMACAIDGTPVDCAKLGLFHLLPSLPDLLISGIDRGGNMCVDVFYSGTVAVAFEGAFRGVPSFAVSLANPRHDADFSPAAIVARTCVEAVFAKGPEKEMVYNINVPPIPLKDIRGIRTTRLGKIGYSELYEERMDPGGRPYFWLRGTPEILDHDRDNDVVAVKENFVSVTPLVAELTDVNRRSHVEDCFSDISFGGRPDTNDHGTA